MGAIIPAQLKHFSTVEHKFAKRDLKGKTVFVKVDWNATIENGKIQNTHKIDAAFETIDKLLAMGANIVVVSHFGRPKAEYTETDKVSLRHQDIWDGQPVEDREGCGVNWWRG